MRINQKATIASYTMLAWLTLLQSNTAFAANRYVRPGATGTNNGSDWDSAYTALPTTLTRGDVYYLADGSYGTLTLATANGSGIITIKKAIADDHGAENGWVSTYGDGTANWSSISMNISDVVFDGQTGADRAGYGFETSDMSIGASHLTIKYANIHKYPEGTARTGMTSTGHILDIQNRSNIVFSHCYIHHAYGCPFLWRDNTGITIEYCFIADNRSEAAFHAEGISDNGSDNIIIRYNKWCDISGTGFIAAVTSGVLDSWDIYGNVFYHTGTYGASVSGIFTVLQDASNNCTATNWNIYNNTIATVDGTPNFFFQSATTSNVVIRNNLFWQNRTDQSYSNYISFNLGGGSGSSANYSYWGLCAFPYSMSNTANENPIYDGPNCRLSDAPGFPGFVNASAGDFRLMGPITGYPGLSLSSPYNMDIDGTLRGSDGVWERGAYEYKLTTPVEPSLNIRQGHEDVSATFTLFNVKGQKVCTLTGAEIRNGKMNQQLKSGIYIAATVKNSEKIIRKITVMH